ncbi:MAG: hypothetical protein WD851_00835 [Pirellulales bacterium]
MPIANLQDVVHGIEPAAILVEPRILRRVVRLDRRLQGQWLLIPRRECYTIERDRLLAFVDREELEIPLGVELPRRVILLSRPNEPDPTDTAAEQSQIHEYLRLLCYGCVHLELENQAARHPAPEDWGAERRAQIGEIEFAEIRAVLLKEGYLFQTPSDFDTYVEFAAVYLELRYFARHELRWYFPNIDDWHAVDQIVSQDIDHRQLIQRLRSSDGNAFVEEVPHDSERVSTRTTQAAPLPPLSISDYRQLQSKAHRAAATGNGIKATLLSFRALQRAPRGHEAMAQAALRVELTQFVQRLKTALHLSSDEADRWLAAIQPLLAPAVDGFWSYEARLLYDLQKVCVEQERGVYRLDLMEWIRTLGKTPVRRPLPLMQEALMLRHLSTANRRVSGARLRPEERARLANLVEGVLPRIETRLREHLRQIIGRAFDEVGLQPQNVPEQVARRKLIEELLDRVVDRGYMTMGDLRDAFSKNDLKLPDVTSIAELARGDQLLRADHRFGTELDGVYRRGTIYQRFPQTLSSLVFGTAAGRFLTQYLFIPYGGAYLLVEFCRHIDAMFRGHESHSVDLMEPEFVAPAPPIDWWLTALVVSLGTWLLLLMHRPEFRVWSLAKLRDAWSLARIVFVDLPARALKSEYVQRCLHSRFFAILRGYMIWPGLLTVVLRLASSAVGYPWTDRLAIEVFLVMALLLNSPLGRLVTELTTDGLMRAWHNLGMRVISAVLQWIMDLFQGLLATLERMVYTVDEWLRFRAGDKRSMQVVKLAGGFVWFFVSYLVVFVFTLLVEPQINPIKHFPVVTVSHKLILPTGPALVRQLTPYLGQAEATTLVVTTILLIPGVFGYLVWELKENWRLYAANRPRHLRPEPIGRHGETMMRLFRPGFHSGTLPKLYTALRKAARTTDRRSEARIHHRRAAIDHVAEDIYRFVERELLYLLEQIRFLPHDSLLVGSVHAATNRIEVQILRRDQPELPATLIWEYQTGELHGEVMELGWIKSLSPHQQRTLTTALTGLFQRTDVAQVESSLPIEITPPFTWQSWVTAWSERGR